MASRHDLAEGYAGLRLSGEATTTVGRPPDAAAHSPDATGSGAGRPLRVPEVPMATTLPAVSPADRATIPLADPRGTTTTPSSLVRWFRDIGRGDVSVVGGKGANLGEMIRAGLPVPPGFVLPVAAWTRFRAESGIGEALDAALAGVAPDDTEALQRTSARLRQIVEQATMPAELATTITEAYAELSRTRGAAEGPVAVRSSATAEDTAQFSFAGMFESFLNVHGDDELLERVKSCWASTFHARVLFYRLKQGMPAREPHA